MPTAYLNKPTGADINMRSSSTAPNNTVSVVGSSVMPIDNTLKKVLHAAAALASATAEASVRAPQEQQLPQVAPAPAAPVAPAPLCSQPQHVSTRSAMPAAPLHLQYTMPIHMPMPATSVPGSYQLIANRSSETSSMFRSRTLRSGKWTPKEEAYADVLIELFEKGHIDEKNGCTLRSFLSRKLHCAPMRISKKYAGKGIGKMVFLSKTKITGIDANGSAAYRANMARLRRAESDFIKVVYPEIALPFHQPPPIHHTGLYHTQVPQEINGLAPFIPAPPAPASHLHITSYHPGTAAGHATTIPTFWSAPQPAPHNFAQTTETQAAHSLPQPAFQQVSQVTTGSQSHSSETKLPVSQQQQENPVNDIPWKRLQSLEQAHLSVASRAKLHIGLIPTAQPTTILQPNLLDVHDSIASQQAQLQELYLSVANAKTPASSNTMTTNSAAINGVETTGNGGGQASAKAHAAMTTVNGAATTTTHHPNVLPAFHDVNASTPSVPVSSSDMPDFLFGFDKVAGRINNVNPAILQQHSPTFTSQSFDDFHRTLGQDLSPLASKNESVALAQHHQGIPAFPVPGLPSALLAPVSQQHHAVPGSVLETRQSNQPLHHPPYMSVSTEGANHQAHNSHLLGQPYSEALSAATNTESNAPNPHLGADSYNIFAQQSAFAASQHSAYMSDNSRSTQDYAYSQQQCQQPMTNMQDFAFAVQQSSQQPTNTRNGRSMRDYGHTQQQSQQPVVANMPTTTFRATHNPNVVSEPSTTSDQATTESDESPGDSAGSASEGISGVSSDNAANDSDASTNSDTTTSRKKMRISYTKSAKRGHRASREHTFC